MAEKRVGAKLRRLIEQGARGCCEYCRSQARFATHPFYVEHIVSRARGGKTAIDNLAYACQGCNNYKYDKSQGEDPLSGDVAQLYDPRRQHWRDHFVWTDHFTVIEGLTPTGRATIVQLRLNRQSLVNLRHILFILGEHPPAD